MKRAAPTATERALQTRAAAASIRAQRGYAARVTVGPDFDVLVTFAEGFDDGYAELRSLRPREAPPLTVPTSYSTDTNAEVKRAYLLADEAARVWLPWALEPVRGAAADQARGYLRNVPLIDGHDGAHHAEGWLAAAAGLLSGYPAMTASHARAAAQHAAELDFNAPAPPDLEAAQACAREAGRALAAAGMSAGDPAAAMAGAQAMLERLR